MRQQAAIQSSTTRRLLSSVRCTISPRQGLTSSLLTTATPPHGIVSRLKMTSFATASGSPSPFLSSSAGHRVFIYGSLRPDINASIHQRFMGKCVPVGPAYFQGRMYVVDKRTEEEQRLGQKETTDVSVPSEMRKYPAVVPSDDPTEHVHGLLFDVPDEHRDEVMRALDEYEDVVGIPESLAEYRRDRVKVRMGAGHAHEHTEVESWMYVWAREVHTLSRVHDGDYRSVYYVLRDDAEIATLPQA